LLLMNLPAADPPPAYRPITNTAGEATRHASRGRPTAAAIASATLLAFDAVIALVATVALVLPVSFTLLDFESGPGRANTDIAVMAFTAAVALTCPAVATLVAGVRTRSAYLTGVVTTAAVAVAVAGGAAVWLTAGVFVLAAGAGIVFAGNLAAMFSLLGLLRPAPAEGVELTI
jgi:hypothetical protein